MNCSLTFRSEEYRSRKLSKLVGIDHVGERMSLEQAIKHGKEKRKPYRGAKAVDGWCKNHGICWICRRNHLHKRMVEQIKSEDELKGEQ